MEKPFKQNVANLGEYFGAYLFSALDYTVTITLGRAEGFDLICVKDKKTVLINVKTRWRETSWPLSDKDEKKASKNFYYLFIQFIDFSKLPNYWIVPSEIISPMITKSHKNYLNTPNKKGGKHKDSTLRKVNMSEIEQYKNNILQTH